MKIFLFILTFFFSAVSNLNAQSVSNEAGLMGIINGGADATITITADIPIISEIEIPEVNGMIQKFPFDSIDNPTPLDKPVCTVGYFHTHTPMTYMPTYTSRPVGPSGDDIKFATNLGIQMPGFVYDYTNANNKIIGGHLLHDPAKVYTLPPERRPLP